MRAIHNFKSLLRSRSRLNSPRLRLSPSDAISPTEPQHHRRRPYPGHKPKPSMDEQELADLKRANEQHAARLLEERLHVHKTRGKHPDGGPYRPDARTGSEPSPAPEGEGENEHSRTRGGPAVLQTAPPVLGIGPGGDDHLPLHSEPASVVADSPAAVDFNVYDRAYAEEIERIRSGGSRPSLYMTRQLGEKDRLAGENGLERDGNEGGEGVRDKPKELLRPNRLADLVAQTIKDAREKVAGGGQGKEGEMEGAEES